MGALTDFLTNNRVGAAIGDTLTKRVVPAIADAVTSPIGKVIAAADKVFEEGIREPLSRQFLKETYKSKGLPLAPETSKQAAERISYGESFLYQQGQNPKIQAAVIAGNLLANKIGNENAKKNMAAVYDLLPMLNPGYNILDEKQRQQAQESPLYQAVTGLTDIGLEVVTSLGSGVLFKGLREGIQLTRKPLSAQTISRLETDADDAVLDIQSQLDAGTDAASVKPKNGIGVHILDMWTKEDPLDLLSNPVVARSHNPRLLSQLGAAATTLEEATNIILAELGSVKAAQKLAKNFPSGYDTLKLSKTPIDISKPLTKVEESNPYQILSEQESVELGGVLDDIIKRSPELKGEWQDWYSKVSIGAGNVSWAPSKFSFVEQLNNLKTSIKTERLLGRGANQIQENIIGGGAYRPFRILTLATTRLRPRGYIELTGLRPMDSIQELSSSLQMSPILRQNKYKNFRDDAIRKYLAAPADEVERAKVIKGIEIDAARIIAADIAEKVGLKNAKIDVTNAISNVIAKRDRILEKIQNTNNGIVTKQTDGAEVTAVDENIKAKLASNLPMLDMREVENVLNAQITNGSKLSLRNISEVFEVTADTLERAFSAAVLIRPGYIPKNSIFEPFVRVLGRIHEVTLPQLYGKEKFSTRILDSDTGEYSYKQLDATAPDVIGGGALREELDPSLTLANVTQPGVFERTASSSFSTIPVNPNKTLNKRAIKRYWGEYAKQVQILRNDPLVSRVMQGLSDNQIIDYMLRDLQRRGKFSDFYRVASGIAASSKKKVVDLNESSAREIIAKSRKLVDDLVPDKVIQKQIVESKDLFKATTAQKLLAGKELPTLNIDADSVLGLVSARDIGLSYQKLINAGFRAIAKPESALFRSPYGRFYANEATKTIVENARRNGIEITSDMWQNQIRPLAQEYALKQVEDTFYAIRRMNNVQYYSRFLLGFPNAMFNSIKYWVKSGFANPYNFALLEQIRTSPWAMGMVVDEDGNPITAEQADRENKASYLVLPFFNKPGKVQAFNYKMNTNMLNFMVGGASPNWLGQGVLNTVVQKYPNLEVSLKTVLGEKLYNQLIYGGIPRGYLPAAKDAQGKSFIENITTFGSKVIEQTFIPGTLKSAIELAGLKLEIAFNKDNVQFRKDAFASTLWSIHTARRVDWELNNPDGEEPSLDESIDLAADLMFWRFVRKLASPFTVTDEPVSILYRDEFDRLELNYVNNPQLLADRPGVQPYQAALQDFILTYGEEAVRNLISGTKYKTSVAPEQEAVRRLNSYEWLNQWVAKNPQVRVDSVGMILNPVVPGDYSPAASANLKISDVGGVPIFEGTKTFAEREADAQIEDGWREYDRITKERDAYLAGRPSKSLTAASNSDIRAWYRDQIYNAEDGLITRNTSWAETFGNMSDTFNENFNLINVALDNEQWLSDVKKSKPEESLWDTVRIWRDGRDSIFSEWNTLPVNSPRRRQIRQQYEAFVFDLAQNNTYFADFANRYLVGDPIIDIRELLGE